MKPEHPTGLEIRFEREMAAVIPGWQSETASLESPVQPRAPRKPEDGPTQHYQPTLRKRGKVNPARRPHRGKARGYE